MALTKEIRDIGGKYIPWPENGFHIRPKEDPPKGLRLSEDCGACRILDYFLDRPSFISDGVSLAGHMYADLFIEAFLSSSDVLVEHPFVWCKPDGKGLGGTSGLDALILSEGDPLRAHYEFKTTSKTENAKPSAQNRRQVIRQRVVLHRSGVIPSDVDFPSVIFIIYKGGKLTGKVSEPFEIIPSDDEIADAERDIDLSVSVYEDILEDGVHPFDHPLLRALRRGGCTRCFAMDTIDADESLNNLLTKSVLRDLKKLASLKVVEAKIKEDVRQIVEKGKTVESDLFRVKHTESGRLSIECK